MITKESCLINHIKTNHPTLLSLTSFPLRIINNQNHADYFDAVVWFDDENYLTISMSTLRDEWMNSTFTVVVHGEFCRSAMEGGKHVTCLGLSSLDRRLNRFTDIATKLN
ncbi:hypothetical protein C1N51_27745 (plasmid) [Vibrio campbellii]|nr:hypothetical protein C1N51_27745 [Vibrio campbellii]